MPDDRPSADQQMEDLLRMARESSEFYEELANALDTVAQRMLSATSPDSGSDMRGETVRGAVHPRHFSVPSVGLKLC